MAFYILTDAACDLSKEYVDRQKDFYVFPMNYTIDNEEKTFYPYDGSPALKELYDKMRDGLVPTTAQINLNDYLDVFTRLTAEGHEVVYLCFSSGLSGTYQTAVLARSMVLEQNPAARLYVVDTLCAAAGQGLLVHFALKKRDEEGLNAEKLAACVADNRQHAIHWFTVDKLDYLYRGGRVSRSTAVVGDMLRIKPVMNVNYEGKLIAQEKVAGRKRSLKTMAEKYEEFADRALWNTVFIAHGDCAEDAEYLSEKVREINPNVQITPLRIGAIIGSHTGPGIMTLFFWSQKAR
ncbi:MAG: DegV family protein [Oscillospiraceae bacterium]|nr:DegV family protein [Oscillospiraceae bacterium]